MGPEVAVAIDWTGVELEEGMTREDVEVVVVVGVEGMENVEKGGCVLLEKWKEEEGVEGEDGEKFIFCCRCGGVGAYIRFLGAIDRLTGVYVLGERCRCSLESNCECDMTALYYEEKGEYMVWDLGI